MEQPLINKEVWMMCAAIGIQAHSGWGALVVVSGAPTRVEVLDRRRVVVIDSKTPGTKQPYHFAKELEFADAEKYLAQCAATSEQLAFEALGGVVGKMREHGYVAVGCAILLASGRALPELSKILGAHPLLHAAEGEFFRQAFWKAAARLEIAVTGIRTRELPEGALRKEIAGLGKRMGPPWTTDQKNASLAAMQVLANPGV